MVSAGAISATPEIALNDLKVGIPELLINIEMAIFGILHLWAFSWKPYRLSSQSTEITDFYGNGKASYQGGRLGLRALIDAMNPLDLLKAIGRSARWLFIGRKNRMLDPSYQQQSFGLQPPQEGSELTRHGTAYRGAETSMSGGPRGRYGETPDDEADVLLAHAQSNPEITTMGTSPYASDFDDHPDDPSSRFYGRSPSPYGDPAPIRTRDIMHSDTLISPLQEQPPIPMPDPYHPPPPYPDTRRS